MRLSKSFFRPVTLASALVLIFILSMGLATTVSASPVISISPNAGPENTWITVNGSGYTANVELYFVVVDTASGLGTPQGYYYANSSGSFAVSIQLLSFSGFLGGPWSIKVRDMATGVYSNLSYYTITIAPPTDTRVTHVPIHISANGEFTGGNGVNGGGTGTSTNPYIIENWAIDVNGENAGIYIHNTTSYFIIRNCLIENGDNIDNGIVLNTVTNGSIQYNVIENEMRSGVVLHMSSYDNITANTITAIDRTVEFVYSSHNVIFANTLLGTGNSSNNIWLVLASNYNLIANNTLHTTHDDLYSVWNITVGGGYYDWEGGTEIASGNNIITNNICGGAAGNIYIGPAAHTGNNTNTVTNNLCENGYGETSIFIRSEYTILTGNISRNNTSPGLWIDGQYDYPNTHNLVENNTFDNNTYGIKVSGTYTGYNTIYLNHIRNNTVANAYDSRTTDVWAVSGVGNYWGDWQTPDTALPYGVVDTPRAITGGSLQDSYPLVEGYLPAEVTPTLSINPSTGAVGTTVTFTGEGFTPSHTAYLPVIGSTGYIYNIAISIDATGAFSQTYVIHSYDNVYFHAIDSQTATQSNTVTFTKTGTPPQGIPTISINPSSGSNNALILVIGSGFTPNENVYMRFSNLPGIPYALLGVSDSVGSFNLYYRIPGAALVGELYFGAFDFGTSILSNVVAYNVTIQENVNSTVYITPTSGVVGQNVSVFGDNFSMTTTLYIYFDNVLIWNAVTGHLGSFVEQITIPSTTAGVHYISVYDPATHSFSENKLFTVLGGPPITTTTPPVENGTIDIIGLVAPLVGGDRTIAGIAIGSVGVMFFAIIGLGIIAGGRSKEYANLILLVFALLGIFVVTIAGFYPWWILISLLAIITFILAFK